MSVAPGPPKALTAPPLGAASLRAWGSFILVLLDCGVHAVAENLQTPRMPRIGKPAVADVGERRAAVRIGPAVRGPDTAVTVGPRRCERPESANDLGRPAHVRSEPAMHRHLHVLVDAVGGVVAGDVGDGARRQDAHAVQ